ncbi:MAG: hypothetical protein IT367_04865 [Candidatus Hydrogenedentes bacterium]|nr:hypothetical protein [Candidatus Hydrogenedentota bacterium]
MRIGILQAAQLNRNAMPHWRCTVTIAGGALVFLVVAGNAQALADTAKVSELMAFVKDLTATPSDTDQQRVLDTVRKQALKVAGELGETSFIKSILHAMALEKEAGTLNEEQFHLYRMVFIQTIPAFDKRAAALVLAQSMEGRDEFIRQEAGEQLEFLLEENSSLLRDIVKDTTEPPRGLIAFLFTRSGPMSEILMNLLAEQFVSKADDQKRLTSANGQVAAFSKPHADQSIRETKRAETIAALKPLATDERWWVRLYVACTLQRNSQLYDADLVGGLSKDPDAAVHRVANELRASRALPELQIQYPAAKRPSRER